MYKNDPISIMVYGDPAPQGSKTYLGKGVLVESSKRVKPWRQAVKFAALEVLRRADFYEDVAFDCPVKVSIRFYLHKPKSAPKKRYYPDRKPDLDKLIRSTLDALKEAGCYKDDSRVVKIEADKCYAELSGAQILIEEMPPAALHIAQQADANQLDFTRM